MGKGAARLRDRCTGHLLCFPPRANCQGSPDVFINNRPAHRQHDKWLPHQCLGSKHDSVLAKGSPVVFTNGKQQGRIGDPVQCGSKVATGSPDVFVGDTSSAGSGSSPSTGVGGVSGVGSWQNVISRDKPGGGRETVHLDEDGSEIAAADDEVEEVGEAELDGCLAWGKKVSPEFRRKIVKMAADMGLPPDTGPDWLMSTMAFESARTFSPGIKNAAGSGATGLIQFMPSTAVGLGTTTGQLSQMTAEGQLSYVQKYFKPYRGRMNSLEDTYMAVLKPSAIGKPNDHPLFRRGTTAYYQNRGLDANRDGIITKGEAAAEVRRRMAEGNRPENRYCPGH